MDEIKIMTESSASRKNLIFDIASKEVINRKVKGDYGHVLRAMLNIVSNAVKYTPDGGFAESCYKRSLQQRSGIHYIQIHVAGITV